MKTTLALLGMLLSVAVAGCSRDAAAQHAVISVPTGHPAQSPVAARVSDRTAVTPAANIDARYREVRIPAGTRIGVRLNSSVSSYGSHIEESVDATLTAPVKIRGANVVPSGSHVNGVVVVAQRSGKVKGRAQLAVRFRTLTVGDDSYPIAAQVSRVAPATKLKDAETIGIPAAGGAVIGGIIGGKKGAAIGAAAGGGAGTAVVLSTPGKEVSLPKGSVISLRLEKALTVRVPIKG